MTIVKNNYHINYRLSKTPFDLKINFYKLKIKNSKSYQMILKVV